MNPLVKKALNRDIEDNISTIKFSEKIQKFIDDVNIDTECSTEKFYNLLALYIKHWFSVGFKLSTKGKNLGKNRFDKEFNSFYSLYTNVDELIHSLENYLPDNFSMYMFETNHHYDLQHQDIGNYRYNFIIGTEEEILSVFEDIKNKCKS